MRRALGAALGAALYGGMACSGGDAATAGVVRSDSSGVAIVTSPGEDRPLNWRLVPEKNEDTGGMVVAIHRVERGS